MSTASRRLLALALALVALLSAGIARPQGSDDAFVAARHRMVERIRSRRVTVTAAPPSVPDPLLRQLKTGGRLVIPVGDRNSLQSLLVLTKRPDGGFDRANVMPVFFVPMTGEAQQRRER